MISNKVSIIAVFVIITSVLLAFRGLTDIFFEQDEWYGMGRALYHQSGQGIIGVINEAFAGDKEIRLLLPLTGVANYLIFTSFKTNFILYGYLSIILVVVNASLAYFLFSKISRSSLIGLGASIWWITNGLASQSFTWISTLIPSQFSNLFFLLSLYFLTIYAQNRVIKRYLVFAVTCVMLSLLFKAIAAFYVLLFVLILYYLFRPKISWKSILPREILLLLIPLVFFFGAPRLLNSFHTSQFSIPPGLETPTLENIVYNAFLLPARSLGQVVIPSLQLFPFIRTIGLVHYPRISGGDLIEGVVGDVSSLIVAFYILLAVCLVTFLIKDYKKIIIFSLLAFFASTLPFIQFQNYNTLMEPRYYSYPALWFGLLLSTSIYGLTMLVPRINSLLFILIMMVLIFINIKDIDGILTNNRWTSNYRKDILATIAKEKPVLKEDNIFFFSKEGGGFYDFQSGFGQTLAVWLYDSGKIPRDVLMDNDFWDLNYEGIKSYSGQKYGYFMNYGNLLGSLKNNPEIKLDSVHSFNWNSQDHYVTDVSEEVREKLGKDLNRK